MLGDEGFFDLLSRFQSNRMDDQRCSIQDKGSRLSLNSGPESPPRAIRKCESIYSHIKINRSSTIKTWFWSGFSLSSSAPSSILSAQQLCQSLPTSRAHKAADWRSRQQQGEVCPASDSTKTATRLCSATWWPTLTTQSPMTTSLICSSSARWVTPVFLSKYPKHKG